MKKVEFEYVLLTFLIAFSFGKFIGGKKEQKGIENRAKKFNKECITKPGIRGYNFRGETRIK